MDRTADIVLDSYPEERDAVHHMHQQAETLRNLRATKRYGVFIEKHAGVWWLILHDRGSR